MIGPDVKEGMPAIRARAITWVRSVCVAVSTDFGRRGGCFRDVLRCVVRVVKARNAGVLLGRIRVWRWDVRTVDVWSIEASSCAPVTGTPSAAAGTCR